MFCCLERRAGERERERAQNTCSAFVQFRAGYNCLKARHMNQQLQFPVSLFICPITKVLQRCERWVCKVSAERILSLNVAVKQPRCWCLRPAMPPWVVSLSLSFFICTVAMVTVSMWDHFVIMWWGQDSPNRTRRIFQFAVAAASPQCIHATCGHSKREFSLRLSQGCGHRGITLKFRTKSVSRKLMSRSLLKHLRTSTGTQVNYISEIPHGVFDASLPC